MAPATKVPRTAVDVRVFSYDLRHFVLWVCYEFLTNSEQNAYLVWSLSLNGPFNFCNLFFYFKVLKCSLNELSGRNDAQLKNYLLLSYDMTHIKWHMIL